ncbi:MULTISPECIES: DJ-1/PfpI family protein [Brevibacillus]|jgi:intracellular protease, PfpI family|uniref:DJ-1/PfpI family protein n=1 Tax=Brevibacillus TaxID=55080 RepID=UPI00156B9EC6|nr:MULTISPECIES: DJ-1/PfpI family protein [Brevibacillus]MDR4998444.1 DJ-1/PfpI family protein [Brevibacillus parabrevis]MED2255589.1 DJ-1/PfpI family protein [Brevibacillus parabrevis]UED68181.1 DJ-1/PfpI family protein [Brevibacillus sp. HD3.3A]WDV94452.1 DJ-1/PfpI family protein [Brevibacillus parabrevis]
MSKKVLIVTGDAVEALEVFYPYYRLLEEGYEAVIAAPSVKTLHTVCHDFEAHSETYTEKPAYQLPAHAAFADVNPEAFDALIIPGGRAPEHIRLNENLKPIVSHFFEANKPVAAICHGSQVLAIVSEHLAGRTLTAYQACRPDVEAMGAIYEKETLHVDGNLVSGHAWPDLPGFMREFLRLLR